PYHSLSPQSATVLEKMVKLCMRLWSIHLSYLDPAGLVALWREALLAQKVLWNETKGYRHHPQLVPFRISTNPHTAIATYLTFIAEEADSRGYKFDTTKIRAK